MPSPIAAAAIINSPYLFQSSYTVPIVNAATAPKNKNYQGLEKNEFTNNEIFDD